MKQKVYRLIPTVWLGTHRRSLLIMVPMLVFIALVHGINMGNWPGPLNGDEGIYTSQAWSVQYMGRLSPYEYWYDHPPLGWLAIALWSTLTMAFERHEYSLLVGREVMLIANVVGCGLLYMLARRLGTHRVFALVAVAIYAFNPISLLYHRLVFLDNLSVVFLLAAMVFAASPKRSLDAAVGAGVCFGAAMLSKETTALLFPMLVWLLVQHTAKGSRKWNLAVFGCITFLTGAFYPLYALLKKEFLAGPGHVSLQDALVWQLASREGTGSLLDPSSGTSNMVSGWLGLDPWLLPIGIALIPVAFFIRNLRPVAGGLLLLVLVMFGQGYLPYPYIIGLLPFTALLIGGVASHCWPVRWRPLATLNGSAKEFYLPLGRGFAAMTAMVIFFTAVSANWAKAAQESTTVDQFAASRAATDWIDTNISKDAVIIVGDYQITDVTMRGYGKAILFNKADLDPAVKPLYLPNGYKSVDYLALGYLDEKTMMQLPIVAQAIRHSTVVKSFGDGQIIVYKVKKS